MAKDSAKATDWLTSQQAREQLRVSSCELMHLREAGQLKFEKKGNAFLYAKTDVLRLAHQKSAIPLVRANAQAPADARPLAAQGHPEPAGTRVNSWRLPGRKG